MTQSQLERDLLRNARERLQTWIKDTVMRNDVARLPPTCAAATVLTCLTDTLVRGLVELDMSREDFLIMLQQVFERESRIKRREAGEKP